MNDRNAGGWLRWRRWAPFHVAGFACGWVLASDAPGSIPWAAAVAAVTLGAPAGIALLVTRERPKRKECQ